MSRNPGKASFRKKISEHQVKKHLKNKRESDILPPNLSTVEKGETDLQEGPRQDVGVVEPVVQSFKVTYTDKNALVYDPVVDEKKLKLKFKNRDKVLGINDAREIVDGIRRRIADLLETGVLFVWAGGIDEITMPCARYIVRQLSSQWIRDSNGHLIRTHPISGRHIVLVNLNAVCAEALHFALREEEVENAVTILFDPKFAPTGTAFPPNLKKAVFYKSDEGTSYGYLGMLRGFLEQVLETLRGRGSLTAAEIAHILDIGEGDAASRLSQLFNWGAIDRLVTKTSAHRTGYLNYFFDPTVPYRCEFVLENLRSRFSAPSRVR